MSCYELSRLMFDLKMSEATYQSALQNFEQVMTHYDLSAEEKDALRSGDPRRLRQLGVHGMLCLYLKRLEPKFRDNIYWMQK